MFCSGPSLRSAAAKLEMLALDIFFETRTVIPISTNVPGIERRHVGNPGRYTVHSDCDGLQAGCCCEGNFHFFAWYPGHWRRT